MNRQPKAATQAAPSPCLPAGTDAAGGSSIMDLDIVRLIVSAREKVSADSLDYIGMQDERGTVGKRIYHFNIIDPTHWCYRSTVSYTEVVR